MEQKINITPEGNEMTIRTGAAERIYEYNGFNRKVHSVDSFVRMVQAKCGKENCVISYNDGEISALVDDTIVDREQDFIRYAFVASEQFVEFKSVFDKTMTQRDFIKFLQRREPNEITDLEQLLASIQQFKYVTNIVGDANYEDNNNYTFAFKMGDAEGTVRLPQYIMANLEIFNESKFFQFVELELEVNKPRSESDKLTFTLRCPKLSRYTRQAMLHEVEVMQKGLPGYLIVAGELG